MLPEQRADLVETLWMARHDNDEQVRHVQAGERVEDQRLFSFAGAGCEKYFAVAEQRAKPRPQRQHFRWRRAIELDIAGDFDSSGTKFGEPRGIAFGLSADPGELAQRGSGQAAKTRVPARGFFRHPGVYQVNRDAVALAVL